MVLLDRERMRGLVLGLVLQTLLRLVVLGLLRLSLLLLKLLLLELLLSRRMLQMWRLL